MYIIRDYAASLAAAVKEWGRLFLKVMPGKLPLLAANCLAAGMLKLF
jgi:hypothetical protein